MTFSAVFDSYWYWLSAALLLLLLEILIPGAFLMWIGLGAAGVGVFLFVFPGAALAWQLIALAISVTAAVLLGATWQKQSRQKNPHALNQGLESYVGRPAMASEDFVQGQGRIRLEDSSFSAYSDEVIKASQAVRIVAVDTMGFKVKVIKE